MKTRILHIGTSGWSYKDWKGTFYPEHLKTNDWLSFYADHFNAIEINASFYHLPRKQTVINWAAKVPGTFRFCPKISRYITHIKKLREPCESLQLFFGVFEWVKNYLGPVLIQLPASAKFEYEVAAAFFTALDHYKEYDFVLEIRNESWFEPSAIELIRQHNISLVISQSGAGFPYAEKITGDDVYIRFHGPGELYTSSYSPLMLREYAQKIKKWLIGDHNIWAFFNNTSDATGIKNANQLKNMILGQQG